MLPFILGAVVGAVGVVAYKNRDVLKTKSKEYMVQAKNRAEDLKSDIENKIKKPKDVSTKLDNEEIKPEATKTKRTYTRKKPANKEVK